MTVKNKALTDVFAKCTTHDEKIVAMIAVGHVVVDTVSGTITSRSGQRMHTCIHTNGYVRLSVSTSGKQHRFYVHRIVWIAGNGIPMDSEFQVNHLNGIRTDNRISNLDMVSPTENNRHEQTLPWRKQQFGESSPGAKMTESQRLNAISRVKNGETYASIADEYQVSPSSVSRAVNGRKWTRCDTHIEQPPKRRIGPRMDQVVAICVVCGKEMRACGLPNHMRKHIHDGHWIAPCVKPEVSNE